MATTKNCDTCPERGRSGRDLPEYNVTRQRDGRELCYVCVNEINAEIRAAAAAARAAAPKCECCGKRRGTWRLGMDRVLVCGTCKRRVEDRHAEQTAGRGVLAMLAAPPVLRADVFELAGRN